MMKYATSCCRARLAGSALPEAEAACTVIGVSWVADLLVWVLLSELFPLLGRNRGQTVFRSMKRAKPKSCHRKASVSDEVGAVREKG